MHKLLQRRLCHRGLQWTCHVQLALDMLTNPGLLEAKAVVVEGTAPRPSLQNVSDGIAHTRKELLNAQVTCGCCHPGLLVSLPQKFFELSKGMGVQRLKQPCCLRRHQHHPNAAVVTSIQNNLGKVKSHSVQKQDWLISVFVRS